MSIVRLKIVLRMDKGKAGGHFVSFRAAIQFAAPHTWPASVLPALLGAAFAYAGGYALAAWRLLITLVTGVLLQSAVNTLNDYRDFTSGLDTADNCDDPTDAALIYECSNPRAALRYGLFLLVAAAILGAVLTYLTGPVLLIYGGLALVAISLYTLPRISFSYLPLGELLSGIAMGGVLTCASYHIQARAFAPDPVWLSIPAIITIADIMLTNNISDIERDREGGRRTFPVCAGRKASQIVLLVALIVSVALVVFAACFMFPGGVAVIPVLFFGAALNLHPLFSRPLTPDVRVESMTRILSLHKWIITSYIAIIIVHCITRS